MSLPFAIENKTDESQERLVEFLTNAYSQILIVDGEAAAAISDRLETVYIHPEKLPFDCHEDAAGCVPPPGQEIHIRADFAARMDDVALTHLVSHEMAHVVQSELGTLQDTQLKWKLFNAASELEADMLVEKWGFRLPNWVKTECPLPRCAMFTELAELWMYLPYKRRCEIYEQIRSITDASTC